MAFLHKDSDAFDERMKYYRNDLLSFNQDFYKIKINSDPQINELVQEMLVHLKIPKWQWGRYLNTPLSLRDLLEELNKHNNEQKEYVKLLLQLLEVRIAIMWHRILIAAALVFSVILIAMPYIALLGSLVTSLLVPGIGLFFSLVGTGYYLYQNISDDTLTLGQRIKNSVFTLAISALNFARYGVILTAVATLTPVSAILSVAASLVGLVQEIYEVVYTFIKNRKKEAHPEQQDLASLQQQAREEVTYKQTKISVLINLSAAILSTAIVIIWCFAPGGVFLAVGAAIGLALVMGLKALAQYFNNKKMAETLKTRFHAMEDEFNEQQCAMLLQPVEDLSPEVSDVPQDALINTSKVNDSLSLVSRAGLFAAKPPPLVDTSVSPNFSPGM